MEVKQKMDAVNADAALGPDGVNIRAFRDGGEDVVSEVHAICCEIIRTRSWPQVLADSNMTPIPKKAGATKEGEHRGASVSAHASKIMTGILNDRMSAAVEAIIGEYQFGFRRQRGTDDAVLALRLLMDQVNAAEKELHVGYIDLVKAFDTVDWQFLYEIMRGMGFPEEMIEIISDLYEQTRFRVKTRDGLSEWIDQKCGVRQGCCLSAGLFLLFLEHAIRLLDEGGKAGIEISGEVMGFVGYADDLALVELQLPKFRERMMNVAGDVQNVGMEMSVGKTKTMVMGRTVRDDLACDECGRTDGERDMLICGDSAGRYGCGKGKHSYCGRPLLQRADDAIWGGAEGWEWYCDECESTRGRIMIDGESLEEVDEFDYLGTRQDKSFECWFTILHRMSKATRCFRALQKFWHSRTNLHVKGAVYATLVRTVLLYGAAAWVTTAEDMQILEAWDAANCRFILSISKRQHMLTVDCRRRLNIRFSVEEEVKRARLRMFMKISRASMPESRYTSKYLENLLFNCGKFGKAKIGRPKKSWVQCISDDLSIHGYGIFSGRGLARANAAKYSRLFLE